jgi:hypothetical protein
MRFNGQYRRARGLLQTTILASLPLALLSPLNAQPAEVGSAQMVDCGSTASLDSRLLMQQWAAPGACTRPVRTRVTDRFLGFTCVENGTDAAVCRSYVPGAESRAHDTSKFFRCVELGLTGSAEGVAIGRIREWAAPKDHCDWDPGAGILAMEVDFERSLVCAATLCMPVERLTVIGKLRLKQLLESAFRDLDMLSMSDGPRAILPVHASGRNGT